MVQDAMMTAMANRSLRTIRTEFGFLADASIISQEELAFFLNRIPKEKALYVPLSSEGAEIQTAGMAQMSINSGDSGFNRRDNASYSPSPSNAPHQPAIYQQPPPSYPASPAPPPSVLIYATALYAYQPTDAGDLAITPNDRIAVTEYMNAEWWKGRSERTGQEGIFPRSYVRVEEDKGISAMPVQSNNYGSVPLEVSQGGSAPVQAQNGQPSKGAEMGKKFGKKLGNAAIFGAGATMGADLVNSIF